MLQLQTPWEKPFHIEICSNKHRFNQHQHYHDHRPTPYILEQELNPNLRSYHSTIQTDSLKYLSQPLNYFLSYHSTIQTAVYNRYEFTKFNFLSYYTKFYILGYVPFNKLDLYGHAQ
jgi:hypothetical protein